MRCHFIPAYLLDQLADTTQDEHVTGVAQRTREIDRTLRGRRVDPPSQPVARAVAATPGADWEIHDAHNGTELPVTWCAPRASRRSGTSPSTRQRSG